MNSNVKRHYIVFILHFGYKFAMSLCIQPDPGEVLNYNKNSTSMHNRIKRGKKN